MKNTPVIICLPVGELDTQIVQDEFEAIAGAFQCLGCELVIAGPVSDEAAARRSVQILEEKNADLLVVVPLRGLSAQTIEAACRASTAPSMIWPVQGNFALPSCALANGALREAGLPIELHYAPPDHQISIEKIRSITRAASAFTRLKKSRIGVIGGLFHNLVSCRYEPQTVSARLGVTILPISYDELRSAVQSDSQLSKETEQLLQAIIPLSAQVAANSGALEAGIQLHIALKRTAQQKKIDAFVTECWTGLPREIGLNPCLGFLEDAYTLACEGDMMLCLSLLISRYLTGTSAYAGDLYELDMAGNLTLVHCGAPASLASHTSEIVVEKSQAASERGFETFTCRPRLNPGPVTLFRYYGKNFDQIHLALADLVSSEQSPNLMAKLKLKGDRSDFLEHCFGNHYVVVAGDIREELNLLGKWIGISIHDSSFQGG